MVVQDRQDGMTESHIHCVVLWSCPFEILIRPCGNVKVRIDVELGLVHNKFTRSVWRSIQGLQMLSDIRSDRLFLCIGAEGSERLRGYSGRAENVGVGSDIGGTWIGPLKRVLGLYTGHERTISSLESDVAYVSAYRLSFAIPIPCVQAINATCLNM